MPLILVMAAGFLLLSGSTPTAPKPPPPAPAPPPRPADAGEVITDLVKIGVDIYRRYLGGSKEA